VCSDSDQILAFLFVKCEGSDEDYSDIEPVFPIKKRLKIGTLKVTLNGFKIGERFLKIIFDNAIKQRVDEIYVTVFNNSPDKERLISLLIDWGFQHWGIKKTLTGNEEVYVRDFGPSASRMMPKLTFPYISMDADCYMVPIWPEYHTNLFPDSILNTESTDDFVENEPFRNALSKVYVCRSVFRNLKSGDIIIFYRTGGYHQSVITTIGIVESAVDNIKDENTFLSLCRKRSVFSNDELLELWNRNRFNKPYLVNFLYCYSLPKRINLKKLIELGIISGIDAAPRGFEKISKQDFELVVENTGIDRHILVT